MTNCFQIRMAVGAATALVLGIASAARADVVDATSTTLIYGREEPEGIKPGQISPNLRRVVPAFEMISLSAREIGNPYADHLEVVLSTWGAVDLGDLRWDPGLGSDHKRLTGDIDTLYVRGEFLSRALKVRLGREVVFDGVARATHLDGGDFVLQLPEGFGVSGYVGSPVSSRFQARGGDETLNPIRGNFATGGRAFWIWPAVLDFGFSTAYAQDHGDPSRRDIGADLRVYPHRNVTFLAYGLYNYYEGRVGEGDVAVTWRPIYKLQLTADYLHTEPDLFLPRDSILAVFSVDKRNDLGGNVHFAPLAALSLDADYHVILVLQEASVGHRGRVRATWRPPQLAGSTVGAELQRLKIPENGYYEARVFGAKEWGPYSATVDFQEYHFDSGVNGEVNSFIATLTGGYAIGRGWSAVVAASGGETPFLSRRFDLLAKLVYNQTYSVREVR